jgi:cyclopropane-fatty-acyl-phospholipid synthase
MKEKKIIKKLLNEAGIMINGDAPQDIQVNNEKLYSRVSREGSLGLGESYMDGWWDAKKLDEFFYYVLKADLGSKVKDNWKTLIQLGVRNLRNPQRITKAFEVGERHYDVGNDLYEAMLDDNLTYTCGYWKDATTLNEAQAAKLDLVCKKLDLKPGQKVLDIGCGWGSFAIFAAKNYGVHVTGITVSREQVALGMKRAKGLPVEIRLQDYRDIEGMFDHVVSLGMFEHVGQKNYRTYMKMVHNNLRDDGLFLLHTIGRDTTVRATDLWIAKYIFPNSVLPSIKQIGGAIEGLFVMEDWHNFGADYDKTLMSWYANVEEGWYKFKDNYDERFHRMWKYYLLSCAGSFRARRMQLWQVILSKNGVSGGWKTVR